MQQVHQLIYQSTASKDKPMALGMEYSLSLSGTLSSGAKPLSK
jgi:hypothetical protein